MSWYYSAHLVLREKGTPKIWRVRDIQVPTPSQMEKISAHILPPESPAHYTGGPSSLWSEECLSSGRSELHSESGTGLRNALA